MSVSVLQLSRKKHAMLVWRFPDGVWYSFFHGLETSWTIASEKYWFCFAIEEIFWQSPCHVNWAGALPCKLWKLSALLDEHTVTECRQLDVFHWCPSRPGHTRRCFHPERKRASLQYPVSSEKNTLRWLSIWALGGDIIQKVLLQTAVWEVLGTKLLPYSTTTGNCPLPKTSFRSQLQRFKKKGCL